MEKTTKNSIGLTSTSKPKTQNNDKKLNIDIFFYVYTNN